MALTFLFVLYCLEAGVFFTVAPWTRFWSLNPLLHYNPLIALIADNAWFRGFVSGFGLAHFIVGIRELYELLARRESRP